MVVFLLSGYPPPWDYGFASIVFSETVFLHSPDRYWTRLCLPNGESSHYYVLITYCRSPTLWGRVPVQKHQYTCAHRWRSEVNIKYLPVLFCTPCLETDSARPVVLNLWLESSVGVNQPFHRGGLWQSSSERIKCDLVGGDVAMGVGFQVPKVCLSLCLFSLSFSTPLSVSVSVCLSLLATWGLQWSSQLLLQHHAWLHAVMLSPWW